jgi:hypothetical protein
VIDVESAVALVTVLLTLVSLVLGAKYKQSKDKAKQFVSLANRAISCVNTLIDAAEDDEVTEEEFRGTVAAVKRLVDSVAEGGA